MEPHTSPWRVCFILSIKNVDFGLLFNEWSLNTAFTFPWPSSRNIRLFALVLEWVHMRGIHLLWCLGDWLIIVESIPLLLQYCNLGIVINIEKSDLEPTSKSQYLRILIDTIQERVFLKDSQIIRFESWQTSYFFSCHRLQRCANSCWAAWLPWNGLFPGVGHRCALFSGS